MSKSTTLIRQEGEIDATGGEDIVIAAYTVPATSQLFITDWKVMGELAEATAWFYINEAVLGHVAAIHLAGSGVLSKSFETPLEFIAGQIITVTCVATAQDVIKSNFQGELLA